MSDRFTHRATQDTGRSRAIPSNPRRVSDLPDPPDNPEFELLSPEQRDRVAKRFEAGVALTERNDVAAYRGAQQAWRNWVHRCYQNRLREREQAKRDNLQREAILEQNRRRRVR